MQVLKDLLGFAAIVGTHACNDHDVLQVQVPAKGYLLNYFVSFV